MLKAALGEKCVALFAYKEKKDKDESTKHPP